MLGLYLANCSLSCVSCPSATEFFAMLFLLFARPSSNSPWSFQCFRQTLRRNFNCIRQQMKNFPRFTLIYTSCVISSQNLMFDHLLESSRWDYSNKWSNIGFGEERGIRKVKIRILSGALVLLLNKYNVYNSYKLQIHAINSSVLLCRGVARLKLSVRQAI